MNLFITQAGGPAWQWQNNPVGTWSQDSTNPNLWGHNGNISNANFDAQWALQLDADPFVSNAFALTNNTAFTQTYSITIVLPVSPIVNAPSTTLGSIAGSVSDANSDGFAQLSTIGVGSALYTSIIDGVDYQQLLADPFSVTVNFPSLTQAFPASPAFFALTGQPGVNTSIAIRNTFSLSAGDSVTFTSTFRVDPPVPAPAAGMLAAIGCVAGARRRRSPAR
jgi:hypothetical protein